MIVSDLIFEVRNASLARVGLLTPDDGLTTFKATLRLNNVGSWEITIPENRPLADALRAPGAGLIVTGPNGVILSGPTTAVTKTNESGTPIGSWLIRGTDDSIVLGERLAYPTPSTADVTAQTSAYDVVTSVKASTAMIGYVNRNIGSSAPAARKITGLSTVTDPVVGSNISYAARFDVLGQVLADIAGVDGLAFDMYQSGSSILFNVWSPADKTKTIRLDVANNTLQKSAYGYGYGISRAIVGGQGVGAARTFTEVTTASSLQTESSFGRRVERFVDQRDESDAAKLLTSGQSALADAGGLITSVDVVPSNDSTMRPLVDFNLGDMVTVVIASQEVSAVITQMSLSITDVGVYVGITVGNPVGVDFEAITAKRQTDATASIATLNAKEQILPAASISNTQLANSSLTVNGTSIALGGSGTLSAGSVANSQLANSSLTVNGNTVALGGSTSVTASQITSGTLPIAQGGSGAITGSAWVPIVPTGTNFGTGSGSTSALGVVSFTSATNMRIEGIFSAAYDVYEVHFDLTGQAANDYVFVRLSTGSTPNITSSYYNGGVLSQAASAVIWNDGSVVGTYAKIGYSYNDDATKIILTVENPYSSSRKTSVFYRSVYSATSRSVIHGNFLFNGTTSFDGLHFGPVTSGAQSGSVQVFGMRKQ
jgi:hypothetical protein